MDQAAEKKAEGEKVVDPYFDLIMDSDLAVNKYPAKLQEIREKGGKMSLMAKFMTPELFEKYKDLKTSSGWTIARAINTGTCYPNSFVGCHAGDHESYTLFKELFNNVIENYHVGYKIDGTMSHVTDLDPSKITQDFTDSVKAKVISVRIRVARNLALFPMNLGPSETTRTEVANLMRKVLATLPEDLAGEFHLHTEMSPEQTQKLIDDHFLFRGKDKMQAASGYHINWPVGRGIFHSKDKRFLLWINEGDQLRIMSMQQGSNIKEVFQTLSRGVAAIEEGLRKVSGKQEVFMQDKIRGNITCCPSNLGTGMRASIHVLVPKLIKKIGFNKIDEIVREMKCQARGSTGEHSEVIDRIDISNWRRLGFSESIITQDLIHGANKLCQLEDEIQDE